MAESTQSSGGLRLSVSRPSPGCVVLHVAGEVDLLTTPNLDAEIVSQLTDPPPALIVDLNDVSFFGSSGIAMLVSAAELAKQREVRLILVADGRAVRRPLEVTSTARLFTIHPSLESALAGVAD